MNFEAIHSKVQSRLPGFVQPYYHILYEYFKFCASGGSRLLLNIGLMTLMVEWPASPVTEEWAPFIAHPIMAVIGYLMTNYIVFNRQAQPSGSQHASRSLLWYGAMWSGKGVNYLLYLGMIWLSPMPYQVAWLIGAIAVSPYTYAVNRWFWETDISFTQWASEKPVIKRIYDRYLRDKLPIRKSETGGIYVAKTAIENPNKEENLRRAIRESVVEDDDVIIVGGGYGFSTVQAAKFGAWVKSYEASEEMVKRLKKTVGYNGVRNRVEISHSIVSEPRYVYGHHGTASITPASYLPSCDVLVLDCEGVELGILREYQFRPRVIIVETHGWLGSSTGDVAAQLKDMGYSIDWTENEYEKKDNMVIKASR